ncbi:hypothetical protein D1Y85_18550 [Paraburkholderia dinghuensis]|uniref:Uncharacterized protein n=1 Tax=Paraburkholderia dinghuensis TaxID=2305225 RepID=A0A3N6N8N7_9BURK|nr:hypothetical protein D1Y85_18550 [Paraburkholderia dinghuensis]
MRFGKHGYDNLARPFVHFGKCSIISA